MTYDFDENMFENDRTIATATYDIMEEAAQNEIALLEEENDIEGRDVYMTGWFNGFLSAVGLLISEDLACDLHDMFVEKTGEE